LDAENEALYVGVENAVEVLFCDCS
jgi:hypothetical protein